MPDFQFDSVSDFFAMGGDAIFVWSSYALFVLFVIWCILFPRLQRRNIVRLIRARAQREAGAQQRQYNVGGNAQQNAATVSKLNSEVS